MANYTVTDWRHQSVATGYCPEVADFTARLAALRQGTDIPVLIEVRPGRRWDKRGEKHYLLAHYTLSPVLTNLSADAVSA